MTGPWGKERKGKEPLDKLPECFNQSRHHFSALACSSSYTHLICTVFLLKEEVGREREREIYIYICVYIKRCKRVNAQTDGRIEIGDGIQLY